MRITFQDGQTCEYDGPRPVAALFAEAGAPPHLVAAALDNVLVPLSAVVDRDARLAPVTMKSIEGRRIYQRSLALVLQKAWGECFPGSRLKILHAISKGVYCRPADESAPLPDGAAEALQRRMQALVDADLPFGERTVSHAAARALFAGRHDKLELVEQLAPATGSAHGEVDLSFLGDGDGEYADFRFGPLVPSTGALRIFDVRPYPPGLILRFPRTGNPDKLPAFGEQVRLFSIFAEDHAWSRILDVENVGDLNRLTASGETSELIKVAEGLQEKKIARIADEIAAAKGRIKFILIAGPSSSGKTTFSKRLAVQLRVNGIKCATISTDDYFRSREETPRLASGEYNFEDLGALDLPHFNKHLGELLEGREIELPKFNFGRGRRDEKGTPMRVEKDTPIVIEGIHCLNEELTASIPRDRKFFIYVSALTQLNLDDDNRIPTTDNRVLRRMVRDNLFRGYPALETIRRWPSVRAGEDKNIFPFQERADAMFNSALIYELAVLKGHALPLLEAIPPTVPEYAEAQRLSLFLRCFLAVEPTEVPPTSILREFIGESSFRY